MTEGSSVGDHGNIVRTVGKLEDPDAGVGRHALRVIEVEPETDPRWEAFLSSQPSASIYHHPGWLKVLQREYHQPSLHLACEDEHGRLHGVLPLLYTRGLPFHLGGHLGARRLASLPRTPVAGPLATDRGSLVALVRAAVDRVSAQSGMRLQLKVTSTDLDGLVEDVVGTPWRMSYVADLPADPELIRFGDSRNNSRIRWAVRKAAKLGVRVRPAEASADVRAWYQLYLDTMRFNMVPPRPYRAFAAMWDVLQPLGLMRLLVAERNGVAHRKIIAGAILLMFGDTVYYAFNGRDRRHLELRPNEAIQWQAIHDSCREGYRRYDLGEVTQRDVGLAGFKSKWGAPTPLYHYYHPLPRELERKEHRVDGRSGKVAKVAWRLVPRRATQLVGDKLYAFL
jgi:CelD/BcsL family acetyltransferase involved in cellulose biosynthesis